MAIGKVGSFATVEPALVDFGAMTERNIDKIKAEEEAKAKAKAAAEKAKAEALKDVKDVDAFKLSGVTGYDQTLSGTVNNMYQQFLDAKESYLNTGDRSYLLIADKIRNEVSAINNESQAIASTLSKFAELSKAGKLNKDIADEKLLELQAIQDGKAKYSFENGKTMITFTDEDGNVTNKVPASGYVTNMLSDLPEPFDLEKNMNETVSKVKASTIESGGALFKKKVTDIESEESANQRTSLQNTAKLWASQTGAMASWYQAKRSEERAKGNYLPLKTSNWTEDEKKEAQDYFYNQLKNKYAKEVTIDAQQPNKSGGSGKEKFTYGTVVTLVDENLAKNVPKISELASSPGKLKGRPVFFGSKEGISLAGKAATHIYATAGDNPVFVFQMQDPTGVSSDGTSGKVEGYSYISSESPDYGAYITAAKGHFKVDDEKLLAKILRGESNQYGL